MQNPFTNPAFSMTELTKAINILPINYGRTESLNLFPSRSVRFRHITIEEQNGVLSLLPTQVPGAPATVGKRGKRKIRTFTIPHIPYDDVVLPEEVQGIRAFGSENECTKIMERSRRGKLHAAKKGRVSVIGIAPFGYDRIEHVDREKTKFEINEEEAKIVRDLFEWVGQERISIKETVRRLKERCTASPRGKGVWNVCTIHRILRNQAYKGEAAFGKSKVGPIRKAVRARWKVRKRNYSVYRTDEENWIKITIPRIIEEELFDIVQKQLGENRKRSRIQRSGRRHLLQGLMVCQCCKYAYYAAKNAKGGRSYYRCTGTDASRFGGTRVCSNKSIRMEILEPVIWEEMKKVLKDTDKVAKEHQLMLLEHKNKQPNDEIEKEISKLEQGIKRLNYVYVRERITQEEYDLEAEEIEKKLKAMRNQKEEVVDEKELQREIDFIISSIKGFASVVESELGQADWEAKLNIIRALVKRVEIDHDNIHIVFRFQELALAEMQKKNVQHYIRSPVLRNWRLIFNFLYYAHLMSSQHF